MGVSAQPLLPACYVQITNFLLVNILPFLEKLGNNELPKTRPIKDESKTWVIPTSNAQLLATSKGFCDKQAAYWEWKQVLETEPMEALLCGH